MISSISTYDTELATISKCDSTDFPGFPHKPHIVLGIHTILNAPTKTVLTSVERNHVVPTTHMVHMTTTMMMMTIQGHTIHGHPHHTGRPRPGMPNIDQDSNDQDCSQVLVQRITIFQQSITQMMTYIETHQNVRIEQVCRQHFPYLFTSNSETTVTVFQRLYQQITVMTQTNVQTTQIVQVLSSWLGSEVSIRDIQSFSVVFQQIIQRTEVRTVFVQYQQIVRTIDHSPPVDFVNHNCSTVCPTSRVHKCFSVHSNGDQSSHNCSDDDQQHDQLDLDNGTELATTSKSASDSWLPTQAAHRPGHPHHPKRPDEDGIDLGGKPPSSPTTIHMVERTTTMMMDDSRPHHPWTSTPSWTTTTRHA